jgi:hypothetical protein
MERLPYIDEHSIRIEAHPEAVWRALISTLHSDLGGRAPGAFARLLGVAPADRRGEWHGALQPGDSLPGFAVTESIPKRRLALSGSHRFSRYALVFELDAGIKTSAPHCMLRAQTWAEFPGTSGRIYRALVIGSRGHRLAVHGLLHRTARRI